MWKTGTYGRTTEVRGVDALRCPPPPTAPRVAAFGLCLPEVVARPSAGLPERRL